MGFQLEVFKKMEAMNEFDFDEFPKNKTIEFHNYLKDISEFYSVKSEIRLGGLQYLIQDLVYEIKQIKKHGYMKFINSTLKVPHRTFNYWIRGASPIKISELKRFIQLWKIVCNKSFYETKGIWNFCFQNASYFSIAKGSSAKLPREITPKLAYLLGFIMGDGCLSDFRKIELNTGCPRYPIEIASDTWDFAEKVLHPLFKEVFGIKGHIYHLKNNKCKEYFLNSKVVYIFLHNICEMPLGKKKGKLRVPRIIKNSSDEVKMNFIAGFLDSDGYVYVKRKDVAFTQGDKRFLEEMKELIENLGFKTRKIYTQHKEWGTTYSLSLSWKSVHDFAKATPSRHSEKSRKLRYLIKI